MYLASTVLGTSLDMKASTEVELPEPAEAVMSEGAEG